MVLTVLAAINLIYQVINKPAELVGLFSSGSYKSSASTWKAYGDLFQEHSTAIMTPEFLAAMAQAESGGNPLVTPPWKWSLTTNIFKIYAPASTSIGLFQYTKPTFQDAKRFCIHNHKVALSGGFWEINSCWFNFLYTRILPSHAIEMTSARLHYYVKLITARIGQDETSLTNQQKLAAVIHLCGVQKGKRFAAAGFDFAAIPKCGSHNPRSYYRRIRKTAAKFR